MDNRFEKRYRAGDTPWDHGIPDANLVDLVNHRPIPECHALDIGCGTGSNAIWLARQHFVVTGCDILPTAIEMARQTASVSEVECTFLEADFMEDKIPGSLWLTLAGNADEPEREIGLPRLSARVLIAAVEPCFEIVSLSASHFGSNQPDPPHAWICLMRKREQTG